MTLVLNPGHPAGVSHYTDGSVPHQTTPSLSPTEVTQYLQPAVEVQVVPQGAKVEEEKTKSLCKRVADGELPRFSEWFDRNKTFLGWAAAVLLAARMLTKRRSQ